MATTRRSAIAHPYLIPGTTGHNELAELAAAIEQDVPSSADIQRLRWIDRVVQAIFARGDGIVIFPEGKLGNVEGQLQLPLARGLSSTPYVLVYQLCQWH